MTKKKTTPISQTIAAIANRLPIGPLLAPRPAANFDKLGLDDDELIAELRRRNWWGYLEKGKPGETRGIEVRQ